MGAKGVILVIDDDEAIRHLVQSVLEDEGHSVLGVAEINTALEAVETVDVRLILLDLILQGESGADFLDQYARKARSHAPVVLLSGWDVPTELPAGVAGHIVKPFDLDDLLRVVEEHLGPD